MKLYDLLKVIKEKCRVDEELRAYLYEDKIELVDFNSGFEYTDKNNKVQKEKDFYGDIMTIYLNNKIVSVIENPSVNLITPANKELIEWLPTLIGVEIEDYNDYGFNPNIQDLLYQSI